ncbi:MAG: hypothetical protein WEC75_09735 [Dehalococcoidia bacterium]
MRKTLGGERAKTRRLALILAAAVFVAGLASCVADPSEVLEVRNERSEPVEIFSAERLVASVPASPQDGANVRFDIVAFDGTITYEARTLSGAVLATTSFTWDEIRSKKGITLTVD